MFPELVKLLVQILLIAGALNLGAVALAGTDLVRSIVGFGQPERIIKIAVGVAGAIAGLEFVKAQMKPAPVVVQVATPAAEASQ